jgi:hypothetical protein
VGFLSRFLGQDSLSHRSLRIRTSVTVARGFPQFCSPCFPLSPPSDVNGNRDLFHAVLILIESHNSNPNTARLNWCGEEKWKWTNDLDFPQKYSTACSNKTENEQTAQNSNGSSQILSALPMRLMVLAKLKPGQVRQRHYSAPKVINSDPS